MSKQIIKISPQRRQKGALGSQGRLKMRTWGAKEGPMGGVGAIILELLLSTIAYQNVDFA